MFLLNEKQEQHSNASTVPPGTKRCGEWKKVKRNKDAGVWERDRVGHEEKIHNGLLLFHFWCVPKVLPPQFKPLVQLLLV